MQEKTRGEWTPQKAQQNVWKEMCFTLYKQKSTKECRTVRVLNRNKKHTNQTYCKGGENAQIAVYIKYLCVLFLSDNSVQVCLRLYVMFAHQRVKNMTAVCCYDIVLVGGDCKKLKQGKHAKVFKL